MHADRIWVFKKVKELVSLCIRKIFTLIWGNLLVVYGCLKNRLLQFLLWCQFDFNRLLLWFLWPILRVVIILMVLLLWIILSVIVLFFVFRLLLFILALSLFRKFPLMIISFIIQLLLFVGMVLRWSVFLMLVSWHFSVFQINFKSYLLLKKIFLWFGCITFSILNKFKFMFIKLSYIFLLLLNRF
jgi:hypothetical protein